MRTSLIIKPRRAPIPFLCSLLADVEIACVTSNHCHASAMGGLVSYLVGLFKIVSLAFPPRPHFSVLYNFDRCGASHITRGPSATFGDMCHASRKPSPLATNASRDSKIAENHQNCPENSKTAPPTAELPFRHGTELSAPSGPSQKRFCGPARGRRPRAAPHCATCHASHPGATRRFWHLRVSCVTPCAASVEIVQ